MELKGLALNAINFQKDKGIRKRKTSHITNSLEANPSSNTRQLVLVFPKSTNTQYKYTKNITRRQKIMETQTELFQKKSQTLTSSLVVFLAKVFQLLGKEEDLKILVELCSLRLQGLPGLKDLNYCSWKTSKDFYHTIKGAPLVQSSQPFLTWGTFSNGRYLTARILESHKTGKECSLSDILEENVDEKYFLSEKAAKRVLEHWDYKVYDKLPGV